jgi:hypothetical protein
MNQFLIKIRGIFIPLVRPAIPFFFSFLRIFFAFFSKQTNIIIKVNQIDYPYLTNFCKFPNN